MANQIIKQPNGKYAIYSTVVDGFLLMDASRDDIIDDWLQEQKVQLIGRVNKICDDLDAGGKPYHQFTKTWEEAKSEHEQRHGKVNT